MARVSVGVAALCGFFLTILLLEDGAFAAFSYDSSASNGPANWYKEYPDCAGTSQSPIDLSNAALAPAGYLKVYNPLTPNAVMPWENNGHTLELFVSSQQTRIAGSTLPYVNSAVQFHFHTPSEHTVNGKHYDMELHLVTNSSVGGATSPLAVIGLFFQIGTTSNALLDMLLPYVNEEAANVTNADIMNQLISELGTQFYEYSGSLTTPPCSQIVHWIVSSSVQTATQAQISAFAAVMGANNRPVQLQNGRVLTSRTLTSLDVYGAIMSAPLTVTATQYLALTIGADCTTTTPASFLLLLQQLTGVPALAMTVTYWQCGSVVVYLTTKGSSAAAALTTLQFLYAALVRAQSYGFVLTVTITDSAAPANPTRPSYNNYPPLTFGRISSSNPALFALLTLLVIPVAIFLAVLVWWCTRPAPCPCPVMAETSFLAPAPCTGVTVQPLCPVL